MKNLIKTSILTIAVATSLVACGPKEHSFTTVETARETAKNNGSFLAKRWRAENPIYGDWEIMSRGDSTIMPKCPQGDGWVTVDMLNPQNLAQKLVIKCSSYSAGIGCMTKQDFKKREQYASQDGDCNDHVPHPIPKVKS